jgi:hypothetical protein
MMRLLSAVGFLALAAGCVPQSAVAPGKSPQENVRSAIGALAKSGYACEQMKNKSVFLCEQEDPKVKFLLGYEEMPPRVVVAMTFTYDTECDDNRLKRINLFHDRVDYAIAYCEEKAIVFVGSYIIPEHGLTAKDLTSYVRWWTRSTLQQGAAAGLFEEEGAGGGGKPASDPKDGTKT